MDFVTFLSQLYGNGEETERKLRSIGYTTPETLASLTPQELSTMTGLSVSHSKYMINYAREELQEKDKKGSEDRLVEIEGVGDRRAKILRERGLGTIESVASAKEEKLAKMLKVPKSTARKIIKSAQETGSSVRSSGMTARETEVLTTQLLSQKSAGKREPKTLPQWVKSFWQFG